MQHFKLMNSWFRFVMSRIGYIGQNFFSKNPETSKLILLRGSTLPWLLDVGFLYDLPFGLIYPLFACITLEITLKSTAISEENLTSLT